jgi:geranylgeranyl diphosphate synthase type II
LPTASQKHVRVAEPKPAVASNSAPGRAPTNHVKEVPQPRAVRERLRSAVKAAVEKLDPARRLDRNEFESIARAVLEALALSESYLGWTMVTAA